MATLSVHKDMATGLWNVGRIILVDYFEMGKTFNGQFYVNLLDSVNQTVWEKHPYLAKEKSSAIRKMYPVMVASSPSQNTISLDTIASASTIFGRFSTQHSCPISKLKKCFSGEKLDPNYEVISEINVYFEG